MQRGGGRRGGPSFSGHSGDGGRRRITSLQAHDIHEDAAGGGRGGGRGGGGRGGGSFRGRGRGRKTLNGNFMSGRDRAQGGGSESAAETNAKVGGANECLGRVHGVPCRRAHLHGIRVQLQHTACGLCVAAGLLAYPHQQLARYGALPRFCDLSCYAAAARRRTALRRLKCSPLNRTLPSVPPVPLPLCLPSLQLQQVQAEDSLEVSLTSFPPPRLSPYPALLCPFFLSIQLQQVKAEDVLPAGVSGLPFILRGRGHDTF